jgi:ribosomal protein S18 acetylase RimI-like enzyme
MRRRVHSGPSASPPLEQPDAPEPASERVPRETLSKTLWGIDWSEHLPLRIRDDIVAHASTFEQSLPFVRDNYRAIFHEDAQSPFSTTRVNAKKERYYRLAGDFFEFKDGDKTVGLLVGTPVDWSTYYIRSAAVLPEYSGRGILQRYMPAFFSVLRAAGIERVEADTQPSNLATMHILTRLSFNVTGTSLSERWGAQVHLTRFLDEGCEDVFLKQFCAGAKPQRRNRFGATR